MFTTPVIYQGTFDPFTSGHLAVLKQALAVFGRVRILLLVNPVKQPLFSVEERKQMIAQVTAGLDGVDIDSSEGLLADYMRARNLRVCVRGVRNEADSAYELESHRLSQVFYPQLQTVFLPCEPVWQTISSTAVKTACAAGRLPAAWVPEAVAAQLKRKYPSLVIF